MSIHRFRNENAFLGNMPPLANGVVTRDGIELVFLEIGYQADKFSDPRLRRYILSSPNGHEAKHRANKAIYKQGKTEVEGWHDQGKLQTMRWYVRQKFGRNPAVAELLVETGGQVLIEGTKRDDFWGAVQTGEDVYTGRNELGILLMDTRHLLLGSVDIIALAEHDEAEHTPMEEHERREWHIEL